MSIKNSGRRFYIGFDIGDAESIVEFSVTGTETVQPATMPGKNAAGQAIPTLYGYDKNGGVVLAGTVANDYENLSSVEMNFKRRPGDLIKITPERERELLLKDMPQIWDEPEFKEGSIGEYARKLVRFVDIVLEEPEFVKRAAAFAAGCDDCSVCVGHPTNWSPFDKFVYESILRKSILGKEEYLGLPLSFVLECESRAAFLYIKNTYQVKLEDKEFVGLMDVGSSTIDISVLTRDSRTCVYDSGSNYLGARSIDYLILEYYIDKACADAADKQLLDSILLNNPAATDHLLLNCRLAKESVFSASDKDKSRVSAKILFADFRPFRLTYDVLVNDICSRPIAPVLKKYTQLPDEICAGLGNMGWKDAFREFILQEISKMESEKGIELNKLFLTGSASRMDFVHEICLDIMPQLKRGDSLFDDTNPSNAIAQGLARVGASEHKAAAFQADMDKFFGKKDGELLSIIKKRIPDLTQAISDPTIGVVQREIVARGIERWKQGGYRTLKDMMDAIESQCRDEVYFGKLLREDAAFTKAVGTWTTDQVGNDIALALQRIAAKHNVYDFTLGELNAFKSPINVRDAVKVDDISVIQYTPANIIAGALTAITAVVSYFVVPFIMGIVIGIIALMFEGLAIGILNVLISLPGGILIAGFAAIALLLAKGVLDGYKENKEQINKWLMKQNLSKAIRNKVNTDDFAKQFEKDRPSVVAQTEERMNDPQAADDMSRQIYVEVQPQVEARANQIKYVIERR